MAGTRMAAGSIARQRRGSLLALALLTMVAVGFVATAAAGARRTDSALDRFREETAAADFVILSPDFDIAADLRRLPNVATVGGFLYVPFAPARPGVVAADNAGGFAALDDEYAQSVNRARILEGRAADQDRPDEFTANRELVELAGLRVGEEVELMSVDPSLKDRATLVGVHVTEFDIGPNAGNAAALFTRAFLEKWTDPLFARFADQLLPSFSVVLEDRDAASRRAFERELESRFGSDVIVIPATTQVKPVKDGLRVQSIALWLLAGVAAGAAVLIVSQFAGRVVTSSTSDTAALTALGLTKRQRAIALLAAPVSAVAGGAVVGCAIAQATTALMPVGYARKIEPDPGIRLDLLAAVPVALGIAIVASAVVVLAAHRRAATHAVAGVGRVARPLPSLASVAATVGLRNLGGGGSPEGRSAARSAVGAVVIGVGGVVAVLTFAVSQTNLLQTPAVHGWQFDTFVTSSTGAPLEEQLDTAANDDRVLRYGYAVGSRFLVNGSAIDGYSFVSVRGSIFPTVLEGREPRSADEALLGRALLDRLGLEIGDTVSIAASGAPREMRVVGVGAVPSLGDGDFGETVVVAKDALDALAGDEVEVAFVASFAPGVTAADVGITPVGEHGEVVTPFLPSSLLNLERAGNLPVVLGAFLAVLAVAAVIHALLVVVRRNRRDVAVLRTLGFVRRQVVASVTSQAVTYVVIGIALGAPLGFVIGRLAWSAVARSLGVQEVVVAPLAGASLVAVAAFAVAAAAALFPAQLAARVRPADVLRSE